MKHLLLRGGLVTAGAAVAVVASARPAAAQLDPGLLVIRQGGTVVGEIFVPFRTPAAEDYVEHWVLFPGYIYPSAAAAVVTEIAAADREPFSSATEFFRQVAFPAGSRYVLVTAHDTDLLPNAHPTR